MSGTKRKYDFGPDQDKRMCIYLVTHMECSFGYVGQSIGVMYNRWREHVSCSFRGDVHCRRLHSAIRKYGVSAFKFEVLEEVSSVAQLTEREAYYIRSLNTLSPRGYNLVIPDQSALVVSAETRERMLTSRAKSPLVLKGRRSKSRKAIGDKYILDSTGGLHLSVVEAIGATGVAANRISQICNVRVGSYATQGYSFSRVEQFKADYFFELLELSFNLTWAKVFHLRRGRESVGKLKSPEKRRKAAVTLMGDRLLLHNEATVFECIIDCANALGIKRKSISSSLYSGYNACGYTFRYISKEESHKYKKYVPPDAPPPHS